VISSPIACILLLGMTLCFVSVVYVSAYARVAEKGMHRARLVSQLKAVRAENERLRLQRDELRQPDGIAAFAFSGGMKQNAKMAYLKPTEHQSVAQNLESEYEK
jgi:hypothetical protein